MHYLLYLALKISKIIFCLVYFNLDSVRQCLGFVTPTWPVSLKSKAKLLWQQTS